MIQNWEKSRALLEKARQSLAGGVSSPFRAKAPVPLYFVSGSGPRLVDVDGNSYIDYQLAWGPSILGYCHPASVEAIRRSAEIPLAYGAQHELEISVAERIQRAVPCAERVAFTSSGSEAVQLAFRLCRGATGRNKILRFEGHYHGWMDSALISYKPSLDAVGPLESPNVVLASKGQVPNSVENTVVAPWNRLEILEKIMDAHQGEIAGVIMEPVLCNSGCLLPKPGYLEAVQKLSRKHGAVLVFDEVITGFRMSLGGAQGFYGITPDLATFGKAVGGGVPLSVVAGRHELMEMMFTGGVAYGGTFNGNPLSLAGAEASLSVLAENGGAPLINANRVGETIKEGTARLAAKHGIPMQVTGFGTAFSLHFTTKTELVDYRDTLADDRDTLNRFLFLALQEGINLVPDGRMYVSIAHTEKEAEETLSAFDRAFTRLK